MIWWEGWENMKQELGLMLAGIPLYVTERKSGWNSPFVCSFRIDHVIRASFEQSSEAQLSYCYYCCVLGGYCKPSAVWAPSQACCRSECPPLQPVLTCVPEAPALCTVRGWWAALSLWPWQLPHHELASIPAAGDLSLKYIVLPFLKSKWYHPMACT